MASVSASSGATRVARRAGPRAATTVVSTPTATAIAIAPRSRLSPEVGSEKPIASNSPLISSTKPNPPAIPRIEASTPTSAASTRTAVSTWREEAPRVRSIANSRVRWATVIENVLKIRKAPTKTATPAKTRRAVERKPKPSWMSPASSAAVCSPVRTSTRSPGQRRRDRRRELARLDPVGGGDVDLVHLALLAGQALGLLERELDQAGAAERGAGPELADPRERVVLLARRPR